MRKKKCKQTLIVSTWRPSYEERNARLGRASKNSKEREIGRVSLREREREELKGTDFDFCGFFDRGA
jgi:hypothetical protein